MKKYIYIFFALSIFFSSANAMFVTKETATKVAETFFKIQSGKNICIISDIYTESFNNTITFYAFSFSPSGFVIVSANDNCKPVLGYSITSSFNANQTSPQVKSWLEQYSKEIYNTIQLKQVNTNNSITWNQILSGKYIQAKYIVTPLCTTLWGQDCFYNELCPADTLGPCDHAVTGCVATAIAQIMKFWNYPARGQGSHTYNAFWYGNLTANFGATTYDWASMPDDLISANPAVATLMNHCGISVDMDYYATSSSSNNYYALTALPHYFKYSNNIEFAYRLNYSDSLWLELMKSELDEGRPVLYQGHISGIPAGHSWVCDGYDSNNFLHFNWGDGNTGYWEIGNWIYNIYNEAVIKIMPVVSCDIAVREYISPVPTTFTSPAAIKVKISNYDTLPVTNVPISYSIDGGIPVTETLSLPIAALSDTIYEFIQSYDFTPNPGHVYQVKIFSSLSCDSYKSNDTIIVPIENVACVNPPYSMGFEPSENINGWIMKDINNDGNKWNIGPGGNSQPTCIYYNGGTTQGNDWFISKCLQLDNNKMYKLTYYYKGTISYFPNKLNVYIGNQQDIANQTTLLFSDTNIINTNYLKKEIYFTVPVSESYYIGWYCFSNPDNYSLVLDDISITEQSAIDVGVISTNLPNESCDLQTENISVTLKNYCSTILNNIPVSYSINGGAVISETTSVPIAIGGTYNFTFSVPANFSANGSYNLSIYTSLTGDTLFQNDTLNVTITNHTSISPTYHLGFETSEDYSGWKIYNSNNDSYSWSVQNSGGLTQPYCIRYDYSAWLPADDWFVSSCVNLNSSQLYKLSFWHKIESNQWPEKLNVFIGNSQDISSLTTLLLNFPNLTNMSYEKAESIFTVPSDGLYYIGWHCYSDAVMFNLYIDDISLEFATTDNNNIIPNDFTVFPNPCNKEIRIEHTGYNPEEVNYKISDLTGKEVAQFKSKENSIIYFTNNLNKGVYILKITSSQGLTVKKIMKQ